MSGRTVQISGGWHTTVARGLAIAAACAFVATVTVQAQELELEHHARLSADLERVAITPATQLIASRGPGRLATGFPPSVLRTDQEGTITLPL